MTVQEAANKVKTAFDMWESGWDCGEDWSEEHEACDMAVDALLLGKAIATNADRIRAKTDEELAIWLCWEVDGSGKAGMEWLDWLQSSAEVDDG